MNLHRNHVFNIRIRVRDGYNNIEEEDFTWILSNPPYHADFSVPKHFIEVGYKKLVIGGKLIMITKRLDWYKNKLTSIFGGVKVHEINGYYVFVVEKRIQSKKEKKKTTNTLSKKLQRKQQRSKIHRKK